MRWQSVNSRRSSHAKEATRDETEDRNHRRRQRRKCIARGLERSGYQVRAVGKEPAQVRDTGQWAEVIVLAVPYCAADEASGNSVTG